MNPEQLVPTRELCQKLMKAGIVIDTHWYWFNHRGSEWILKDHWFFGDTRNMNGGLNHLFVPAPTAEELLKHMKGEARGKDSVYFLEMEKIDDEYGSSFGASYANSKLVHDGTSKVSIAHYEVLASTIGETLANALAELAIRMKEGE